MIPAASPGRAAATLGRMGAQSFEAYLGSLDDDALATLLRARPDARVEPLPGGVARLAGRLASPSSVRVALGRIDRDALEVARALGVLGDQARPWVVASLLGAQRGVVDDVLAGLVRQGLVWPVPWSDGTDTTYVPVDALREHVHAEIGAAGRLDHLQRHVSAEALRGLARAHGVRTDGLRKPGLVDAIAAAFGDVHAVVDRVRSLTGPQRERLRRCLGRGEVGDLDHYGRIPRADRLVRELVDAGMVVQAGQGWFAVPDEIAVASWVADVTVAGPPRLPVAPPVDAVGAARAATETARRVSAVLDRAAHAAIPALKSGAVGKRERARLVTSLDLDDDAELCLTLDLAVGAGLLGRGDDGFTTTDAATEWREAGPARRWAALAVAWWDLGLPPTWRVAPDGSAVAPPLVSTEPATMLRRALLETAAPDRSLTAAAAALDWHRPLDPEPPERREAIARATADEAVRIGLAGGDALGPLGIALVSGGGDVAALAAAAADHLVAEPARLLPGSDLTAVLSGDPDAGLSRLLADAADVESRGAATTYRFSPTSVRHALDVGWAAETLLDRLRDAAGGDLPQPLEYLVADAARCHGAIRVHEVGACVVADESLADEIAATRAMRMLRWHRLAPTVLATHASAAGVLALLRDAGYAPALDDGEGGIVVERSVPAPAAPAWPSTPRAPVGPEEAVARIRAGGDRAESATAATLADLNPRLDPAEVELLAAAVDDETPVHLTYRSTSGAVTRRVVTPFDLDHRWIEAWCHLRDDERVFTVSSILAVGTP